MTQLRNLTPDEVFFIFKEEHRLCSPLDPEADPSFNLQPTSTVAEWLDAIDGLSWMDLRMIYCNAYNIVIDIEEWRSTAGFSNEKSMQGVFELIAKNAQVEVIKPVKLLGQSCLSAAIFKSIKINLESKGIEVSNLSPSSPIEPVLKNKFAYFIDHINRNFTGVIPEIKETETTIGKLEGTFGLITIILFIGSIFWTKLYYATGALFIITVIISYFHRRQFLKRDGMLTIPGIITFRDLVNRIVESSNPENVMR